jgi:hypothetical protein
MSFDDGAIDTRGEAKVIGIDDQTAHRVSLAGERTVGGWGNDGSMPACSPGSLQTGRPYLYSPFLPQE